MYNGRVGLANGPRAQCLLAMYDVLSVGIYIFRRRKRDKIRDENEEQIKIFRSKLVENAALTDVDGIWTMRRGAGFSCVHWYECVTEMNRTCR